MCQKKNYLKQIFPIGHNNNNRLTLFPNDFTNLSKFQYSNEETEKKTIG